VLIDRFEICSANASAVLLVFAKLVTPPIKLLSPLSTMTFPMAVHQMCAYAAAAGALSHWTYFIHGEHHVQAPHLLGISMASPILICLGIWKFTSLDAPQAAILAAKLVGSYSTALWSSILLYRVFFHRLRAFPGPWMAKTSKLWHVWKLAPRSDNFRQLDKLHREYGDYVRTGK
jgi:hypothetical protein